MNTEIKVGKIYGQDITLYTLTGVFHITVGGVEFNDTNLMRLVNKVETSDIVVMNEKVLYKNSTDEVETKTIKRLDNYGKYFYDENNNQNRLEDVYPDNEYNRKMFKKMKQTKDAGWELIWGVDAMVKDLVTYPKGHFQKIIENMLDERIRMKKLRLSKGVK